MDGHKSMMNLTDLPHQNYLILDLLLLAIQDKKKIQVSGMNGNFLLLIMLLELKNLNNFYNIMNKKQHGKSIKI